MIEKSSLEELKTHINIVDVISNYIDLKKSGANFKACCPFHNEATSSFVVSPTKQIFHCFGCGAGGDTIKFVQDFEKLSFQEAVEKIASDLNFQLRYSENSYKKDYKVVFEVVNNFYENNLKDEKLEYLLNRGLTKESIKKFELGYAPRSDIQINFMKTQHLNLSEALEVGILAEDGEKLFARQSQRITFPIRSHTNKLIGFGGRTLSNNNNIAKYINSPQTKLFNKSSVFYGFHIAKEHIYKQNKIVIVEGNLDVIMLHQVGINTAVATMGTSLTKEHILQIKKANAKAIICFDGDEAGKKAAFRASVLLSQNECDGSVVIFDKGLDPADMVKDNRVDDIYSLLENSINIIEYALKYIVFKFDLSKAYEKNQALKESVEYLQTLNSIVANEYKGYLAKLLRIESYHITLGQKKIDEPINYKKNSTLSKADEKIFKTIIEQPNYIDVMLDLIDFEVYSNNIVYQAILDNNYEDEKLRALFIRDDIITYNEEDFVKACKLKQKDFLVAKLKQLATSLDDDVFVKMDLISKKLSCINLAG